MAKKAIKEQLNLCDEQIYMEKTLERVIDVYIVEDGNRKLVHRKRSYEISNDDLIAALRPHFS